MHMEWRSGTIAQALPKGPQAPFGRCSARSSRTSPSVLNLHLDPGHQAHNMVTSPAALAARRPTTNIVTAPAFPQIRLFGGAFAPARGPHNGLVAPDSHSPRLTDLEVQFVPFRQTGNDVRGHEKTFSRECSRPIEFHLWLP